MENILDNNGNKKLVNDALEKILDVNSGHKFIAESPKKVYIKQEIHN